MKLPDKAIKYLLATTLCALITAGAFAAAPAAQYREACGTSGWYFAEGYTGGDFDTWILIQNPNAVETTATVRLFTPEGELDPLEVPLGGQTRTSVYLNSVPGLQEGKEVAAEVKAEGSGIIAERAMYFDYGNGRAGGTPPSAPPAPPIIGTCRRATPAASSTPTCC